MPIDVLMPALSPTMEEGTLAKWMVKEGDSVASGDVLAEIETDKATMEVEAVDEGTVALVDVESPVVSRNTAHELSKDRVRFHDFAALVSKKDGRIENAC